ncbi:MAG: hypothetical protein CVU39_05235 [Chloroflexi bacterium HGW-Chloroflexi-10]|nr:MAG: hypothetical protein CVU39_05235 [Chloroflexi bacterium HGW-Chloroflexi-10]
MFKLVQNDLKQLSRREFLKLSSTTLASFWIIPLLDRGWIPGKLQDPTILDFKYGRALQPAVDVYNKPSLKATLVRTIWQDDVVPIESVTVGDEEPSYNRIWYEMQGLGFVHSGIIQPVNINANSPTEIIPESGSLAEITVPYTDAVWHPRSPHLVTYRLYYGTVYWITGSLSDKNGKLWYKISDDKWDMQYYVDATHVHLIQPKEIEPLSPQVPEAEKMIEIRLQDQAVIAYEYGRPVYFARTATGARFADGDFRTAPGKFITNRKRPSRHMAAGDPAAANSYDLPGIPWVCYLTESGVSFHGTYWHNDYGKPRSHGCINLTPDDARWVYRWTNPVVPIEMETHNAKDGTFVLIQ